MKSGERCCRVVNLSMGVYGEDVKKRASSCNEERSGGSITNNLSPARFATLVSESTQTKPETDGGPR